ISIASISSNGPFSSFIDIDRQLLILEGDGVELSINSHEGTKLINGLGAEEKIPRYTDTTEYKRLTPADRPFCFAGETSITSQLLGSDVIDFNIMTKRGAFKAHSQKLSFDDTLIEEQITTSNSPPNELQKTEAYVPIIQILCCLDTVTWEHNGQVIKIMPYDILVFQQGDGITLKTTRPSRLLKVSITACPL
ncbi:MAG: HutD/Ves family protein, partial [Shewanella oncorhynchi]